jgi:hypothetical protein
LVAARLTTKNDCHDKEGAGKVSAEAEEPVEQHLMERQASVISRYGRDLVLVRILLFRDGPSRE